MENIKFVKKPIITLEECVKETLADPIVFRKGKNYDLLREGLKALD